MLFLIGLGLGSSKDITLKGLELLKSSDLVYFEQFTSFLCDERDIKSLCESFGKNLISADRDLVESDPNEILENAKFKKVALLVAGDVFGATTHIDLVLRAKELNIEYQIVHNASILTAVGCSGLQLYKFGEIVSIPLWTDTWKPSSYLSKILENIKRGLHTLCLLDIKFREKSIEAMMKGKIEYETPRFMTVNVAANQLLQSIAEKPNDLLTDQTLCLGLARIGAKNQQIKACSIKEMADVNLGEPLHCLIIPGDLHYLEEKMINFFK